MRSSPRSEDSARGPRDPRDRGGTLAAPLILFDVRVDVDGRGRRSRAGGGGGGGARGGGHGVPRDAVARRRRGDVHGVPGTAPAPRSRRGRRVGAARVRALLPQGLRAAHAPRVAAKASEAAVPQLQGDARDRAVRDAAGTAEAAAGEANAEHARAVERQRGASRARRRTRGGGGGGRTPPIFPSTSTLLKPSFLTVISRSLFIRNR